MHFSTYKKLIERKINHINLLTGKDYETSYYSFYGGWNLYRVNKETGGTYRDTFGFDFRKSSREMLSYVEGIELGLLSARRVI